MSILLLSISLFFSSLFSISIPAEGDILIYPSEVREQLFVDITPELTGSISLSVFSQMGEIVVEHPLKVGRNAITVNHLAPGTYFAVVRENDVFKEKKDFVLK